MYFRGNTVRQLVVSEGTPKNLGKIFFALEPFKLEVSQGGGLQGEIAGKKICNGDSATMQLDQEVLDHNMFCLLF